MASEWEPPKDAFWVQVTACGTRTLVRGVSYLHPPSAFFKPVLGLDGRWYEPVRRPPRPGERRPVITKDRLGTAHCVSVPSEFDLAASEVLSYEDWEWLVEHGDGWVAFV